MLHKERTWVISQIDSAEVLASKLTQCTWTCCKAFLFDGYIYANDATSGDGAQEYAVLKPSESGDELTQIESVTFSWCSELEALALINQISAGDFDSVCMCHVSRSRFETAAEHRVCNLCA